MATFALAPKPEILITICQPANPAQLAKLDEYVACGQSIRSKPRPLPVVNLKAQGLTGTIMNAWAIHATN